jgi:hypothetical protein
MMRKCRKCNHAEDIEGMSRVEGKSSIHGEIAVGLVAQAFVDMMETRAQVGSRSPLTRRVRIA